MQIVAATTNPAKIKNFQLIFNHINIIAKHKAFDHDSFEIVPQNSNLPEVIEDGDSLIENAIKKLVHSRHGEITIADDSGLFIDILDDAPGIYTARVGEHVTDEELLAANLDPALVDTPSKRSKAWIYLQLISKGVDPFDPKGTPASFRTAIAITRPVTRKYYVFEKSESVQLIIPNIEAIYSDAPGVDSLLSTDRFKKHSDLIYPVTGSVTSEERLYERIHSTKTARAQAVTQAIYHMFSVNRPVAPNMMLRQLLISANYSIGEFADAAGFNPAEVKRILSGSLLIGPALSVRLGKVTGCAPDYWLNARNTYEMYWVSYQASTQRAQQNVVTLDWSPAKRNN